VSDVFQEIPDDIDEDWNWGAIVGGWSANNHLLARAYKAAGDWLVERGMRDDELYEVAAPILFMYRHAMELYLKVAVRSNSADGSPRRGHNLLIAELEDVVRSRFREELPPGMRRFLNEIARSDPDSQRFRYEDGHRSGAEEWADIRRAKTMMDAFAKGMERVIREVGDRPHTG
jgi:hypothetical protein